MDEIIFLGTGGGRYTTLFQERSTGGIILKIGEHQIHIDPGPGALLRMKECEIYPFKTDCIIASHHHIDHTNDLNILIEGMTRATKKKRGTLITTKTALKESVTAYHRNLIEEIVVLGEGQNTSLGEIRIKAVKCEHSHPDTIGFKFYTKDYCLYYTGDTFIYPGFEKNLEDVDYMIANVMLPGDASSKYDVSYHACTDDLIKALENSVNNIKLLMINHFNITMLRANPNNEAKIIQTNTKINTIAAQDSMVVKLK